jgi:hypothetical protein
LRRSVYGKAGAFRPKYIKKDEPYDGVEYRASSNWWLRKPEFMQIAFEGSVAAVKALDDSKKLTLMAVSSPSIIEAINTGNKILAQSILEKF